MSIEKIKEELNKAITEFSIEDFNIYTMNELYRQVANKTNEVIEIVKLLQDYLDEQIFKDVENIDLKQKALENIFNLLIINAGNSNAEIVDARVDLEGNSYSKLSKRLEKYDIGTNKNNWVNDLKGKFIAHKGYNGLKYDGPISYCIRADNTISSFELAGILGFKGVEIDVKKCSDNFIISHESDTKYLDGDLANYIDLTVNEIKSRNIIKNYMGGGKYEDLTGVKGGNKVATLEEVLNVCKKYNMYAILDIGYVNGSALTTNQLNQLVTIIKRTSMESMCIFYGNMSNQITDILKDSIYCLTTIDTNNINNTLNILSRKRNYCISVDESKFTSYKDIIREYRIPAFVWTIDDYVKSDELFEQGATAILTNRLLSSPLINNLKKHTIDLSITKNNGSGTEDIRDGIHTFTSNTYFSKVHKIPKGKLKVGDIIKLKATGKTSLSNEEGAYGRVTIGNLKGGYYDIHSTRLFKNNTYETKEIYYIVTNEEDITIGYGLAGGGYSGNATCQLKDIEIEIYTNNVIDKAFGFLYCYRSGFKFRPNFKKSGIKSVYRKDDDTSILCIEHDNFLLNDNPIAICCMDGYSTQFKYRVVPLNYNNSNNIIQIKFLDTNNNYVTDVNTLELGFTILII